MVDISNVDLYELLDILSSATIQEIKKAYRRKALDCHPDKNPDNPNAAELFHRLSKALEILTDESARAAYDKVINAKKAAALRNKELDSKRKKLKEDLEAKERQAQFDVFREKTAEEKFKAEIERLRKEGSKQLEEEIEYVRKQVEREKCCGLEQVDPSLYRLKVQWKILNTATANSAYDHDSLKKIFSKYGDIAALVVSIKKKGSALLEFTSSSAAVKAHQLEKGFSSNPLSVNWLSGPPPGVTRQHFSTEVGKDGRLSPPVVGTTVFPSVHTQDRVPCFPSADVFTKNILEKQELDFESVVLSRMKQAEEEKRRALERESEKEKS